MLNARGHRDGRNSQPWPRAPTRGTRVLNARVGIETGGTLAPGALRTAGPSAQRPWASRREEHDSGEADPGLLEARGAQRPEASRREEPPHATTSSWTADYRVLNARGHRDGKRNYTRAKDILGFFASRRVLNARGHIETGGTGARRAWRVPVVRRVVLNASWASRRRNTSPPTASPPRAADATMCSTPGGIETGGTEAIRATFEASPHDRRGAQRPEASRRGVNRVELLQATAPGRAARRSCSTPVGIETGRNWPRGSRGLRHCGAQRPWASRREERIEWRATMSDIRWVLNARGHRDGVNTHANDGPAASR